MVPLLSFLSSTLPSAGIRFRSPSALLAAAVVTLVGAVPAPLCGQDLPGPVVDVAWLAGNLQRPELVVLHVGGSPEAFAEGHLPGARYLELGAVSYSRGEMEDPDHVMLDLPADLGQVRTALEEVGVSDHSLVVVTYEGARRVTSATRVLWTLQFMGMGHRSALLDGGTEAWRAGGGAMASEPVPVAPGRLTRAPEEDWRVDREWVRGRLDAPGIALVDGRRREAWSGEREEFPGRAGHIPGAGNLPIEDLFGGDGRLRPREELRDLLAAAGVEQGDTVVAYCHIGLRATAVILAARAAGFEAVLYDGSMNEWARDPHLPLARPGGGL